jgi:hypothetical protein
LGDFGAEKIFFSTRQKKQILSALSQGLAIILSPMAENNHRRQHHCEVKL